MLRRWCGKLCYRSMLYLNNVLRRSRSRRYHRHRGQRRKGRCIARGDIVEDLPKHAIYQCTAMEEKRRNTEHSHKGTPVSCLGATC